ncbi:hypothetical protein ACFE04_022218 [Oxalis oulophora]
MMIMHVKILLKECRDKQLRSGSTVHEYTDDRTIAVIEFNAESDAEHVISERLLTFKDINGLVEQNVKLRRLVRSLSDQIECKETTFRRNLKWRSRNILKNHHPITLAIICKLPPSFLPKVAADRSNSTCFRACNCMAGSSMKGRG